LIDWGTILAKEETGFGTIKCPGCGEAIPISEAIHHQIAERARQEFKAEALEGKRLWQQKNLRNSNEKARNRPDCEIILAYVPVGVSSVLRSEALCREHQLAALPIRLRRDRYRRRTLGS
jgi:hypothetical protein